MKTIFISGANSAIAFEYVNRVAQDYDQIILHYAHRRNRVDSLLDKYGTKIIPLCADLSNNDEVNQLTEILKEYEINEFLHLAAPSLHHIRLSKGKIEEYENEMQVVCWAFLRICQTILPGMVKRNEGRILAVLTEYTITNQPPFLSHYITAKYALLGLIKCIASEYAAKGIRANGISPGMIETDFISNLPQYIVDDNAKGMPGGRNLLPADLLPSIDFLLSKESASINGQNILIH